MKTTVNYGMRKPDGTDITDINDLNGNTDLIDTKLKEAENHAGDRVRHITGTERNNWNQKAITATFNVTVGTTGWSGTAAPFTQTINTNGIFATDNPTVDCMLSTVPSIGILEEKAWNCINRITTNNNSITLYCYKKKPVDNVNIQLKVVR